MAFMYIGIAVVVFIIIFNIAELSVNKQKPKTITEPSRVTINSNINSELKMHEKDLASLKSDMVKEFNKVVEEGIKKTLNNSVKTMPETAIDTKSKMAHFKNELSKYYLNILNDPVFTEVLTVTEIKDIYKRTYMRVMGNVSDAIK